MTIDYIEKGKQYVYVYSKNNQYREVHFQPGSYLIECWGASGGLRPEAESGFGAYTSGIIDISTPTTLFVVLGEEGSFSDVKVATHNPTFNGGGSGGIQKENQVYGAGSGGGATDIRINFTGSWSDFDSLKSRIMVAAGGSGTTYYFGYALGASGGSLKGFSGEYYRNDLDTITVSTSATQNKGGIGCKGDRSDGDDGQFGIGGNWGGSHCSSGGGGGYFGGGGDGISNEFHCSGSGGSSYISGFSNCHSIKKDAKYENPLTEKNPIHYSNYYFGRPKMIDGDSRMPSLTGSFQYHHPGPGAVRISFYEFINTWYNKKFHIISFTFIDIINNKK